MNKISAFLIAPLVLAATACGSEPAGNSETADDFAARINGEAAPGPVPPAGPVVVAAPVAPEQAEEQSGQPVQPVQLAPPTVAQPLPGAAPGAYVPGTLTDPNSSTCGANLMGDHIGKEADLATKAAIKMAASRASEVRFMQPGQSVNPDPTSPRLSIMIDNLNVIRDARCG